MTPLRQRMLEDMRSETSRPTRKRRTSGRYRSLPGASADRPRSWAPTTFVHISSTSPTSASSRRVRSSAPSRRSGSATRSH